jgi:hypothetical protein
VVAAPTAIGFAGSHVDAAQLGKCIPTVEPADRWQLLIFVVRQGSDECCVTEVSARPERWAEHQISVQQGGDEA